MQNFSFKVIEKIYYPKFQRPNEFSIEIKELGAFSSKDLALEYLKFKFDSLSDKDMELKFEYSIERIDLSIAA